MKLRKSERIGAIVKVLSDNPNKIFTLGYFTEKFDTAKSTLSEDISVVKNVFEKRQFYVAISRATAPSGLLLEYSYERFEEHLKRCVKVSPKVEEF